MCEDRDAQEDDDAEDDDASCRHQSFLLSSRWTLFLKERIKERRFFFLKKGEEGASRRIRKPVRPDVVFLLYLISLSR